MNKTLLVAGLLGLASLAAVAFAVVYLLGAQTQGLAAALTVSLAALAGALVVWEHELMPRRLEVEERPPLASRRDTVDATARTLAEGYRDVAGTRGWLLGLLAGTAGALGLAAFFPVLSLAAKPGDRPRATAWGRGAKLVRIDGTPVRAADLEVNSILTVFPEGHTGDDDTYAMANSATVLVRVPPEELRLPAGRASWAPQGLLAYSKVCTHAGCPVALYRAAARQLFCPCHQSTFDVLVGGAPVFGPAARALPQLPLVIAADGTLEAASDFADPIGPGSWEHA